MKSLIVATCVSSMLGLVTGVADASTQEALNERRIASSSTASLRGEIDYSFDSTLNKTRALYRTSLESGNLIKRLFTSPEVHTLAVAYEFEGRTNPAAPDGVRVTLLSDLYYAGPLDDGRPTLRSPLLVIRIGETVLRYPVEIAQMTEGWSDTASERYQLIHVEGRYPHANINPTPNQLHVQRRATARIPICEFLILANGRDVRGTVAGLAFDVSDEVLGGLRRFAAEMAPLTSGPSQPGCTKGSAGFPN
jgi:hypothetical protein